MNTTEQLSQPEDLRAELEKQIAEKESIRKELDHVKLFFSELESTNNHLISATWREREMKKKLVATLAELERTKELVEAQNKRIAESINYARKIQLAINATEDDICAELKNSFVYYRPKDVISGDFPWHCRRNNFSFVAAVDCTGHGVPGAMMSMIGNLLLNDIINDNIIPEPGDILLRLHHAVVRTLKQDQPDSHSSDGMDIGLCRIDLETGELKYAGAHRPLFHLKNGMIDVISGDKFPIGGIQYKGKNAYTTHTMQLEKDSSVFIFSDGYTDQVGGPEGKKIMTKGLRQIIENNAGRSMKELKAVLEKEFEGWKENRKQLDDVLVIGLGL